MFRNKSSDCLIILSNVIKYIDLQKKIDEIQPSQLNRKKRNTLVEKVINMEVMKDISYQLKKEKKLYKKIENLIDKVDYRYVNEWNGSEASKGFNNKPLLMHLVEEPIIFSYLLNKPGINIKVKDSRQNSLLHTCVSHSHSLKHLINRINNEKETKDYSILNELTKVNTDGKSPLRICLENDFVESASHILHFNEISDNMQGELLYIKNICEEISKALEAKENSTLSEMLRKKTELLNLLVNKNKSKVLQAKSNYQSALSAYNENPTNSVLKSKCEKLKKYTTNC